MSLRQQPLLQLSLLIILLGTVLAAQQPSPSRSEKKKGEVSELSEKTGALVAIVAIFTKTETLLRESKAKGASELLNLVVDFEKELNQPRAGQELTKIDKSAKFPLRISWEVVGKQKLRRLTISNTLMDEYLEGSQYLMSLFVREIVRTNELHQGRKEDEALAKAFVAQADFLTIALEKRATSDRRVKEILAAKKNGQRSAEFKSLFRKAQTGQYEARTGEFKKEFNENLGDIEGFLREVGIRLRKENK